MLDAGVKSDQIGSSFHIAKTLKLTSGQAVANFNAWRSGLEDLNRTEAVDHLLRARAYRNHDADFARCGPTGRIAVLGLA